MTTALAGQLPELREARVPPEARGLARDDVRLLVASLPGGELRHTRFAELPELLAPGDVVVVNSSATLPAALPAHRADGGALALHLSTPAPDDEGDRWVVELRRDGARVHDGRAGERLALQGGASAELLAPYLGSRLWVAALFLPLPLHDYLARHGEPIRYGHVDGRWPLSAYQTPYATEPGSAEMPSAGRPFSAELVTRLVARGIDVAPLLLHTGVSSLERGERPYPERFAVSRATAERVNLARRLGGRVVAVGTTVVRALESACDEDGLVRARSGWTDLVVEPARGVRAVDGIVSGFHDPDASHLQLLDSIAGGRVLERCYAAAAQAGYLRHEFGDLHLLLPRRTLRGVQ
ncbi:MAG: S-adenosylmethionine:tRNA ribosyltransferase-isomerase [Solirubrobacteraceae bacterium]|nr:MAG: queuosine biosynthesis protein [Solirubrobacterales bacterium]